MIRARRRAVSGGEPREGGRLHRAGSRAAALAGAVEREVEVLQRGEPYWPAQLAVLAALLLYVALPNKLTVGPSWLLPGLEGALLAGLTITTPRRQHDESRARRASAVGLIAVLTTANIVSLGFLSHYLLKGGKANGHALILSGIVIWITNVLTFALWYWELDRGGPGRRAHPDARKPPDFLFPQMTLPDAEPRAWAPRFIDYLYVSFTNATAFSPTDTMPLTAVAKSLMLVQSLASLLTIGLVVARAVNILA